jgi:hypothetical protein
MAKRTGWLIALTVACALAAVLLPRFAQPLDYHAFADRRAALGIANFLDVASNAGFLLAGIAGLVVVAVRRSAFEFQAERWPYAVFFLGLLLTFGGSVYYHLAPDNATLFWDRLPMTVVFMGLVSSQVVDRVSIRAGLMLLAPMLVVGAASVVYWQMSERAGQGDMLPYVIVQGYTIVVLLLIAVLYPSRYTKASALYYVFAWYVLGKVLESFDDEIYALGHIASGHTLKHLAAAASGLVVCWALARRTLARNLRPVAKAAA